MPDLIEQTANLLEATYGAKKPSLQSQYADHIKYLFSMNIDSTLLEAAPVLDTFFDAGYAIHIDMADYLGISKEGRDGFVSVHISTYLGGGVEADLPIDLPVGISVSPYSFEDGKEDITSLEGFTFLEANVFLTSDYLTNIRNLLDKFSLPPAVRDFLNLKTLPPGWSTETPGVSLLSRDDIIFSFEVPIKTIQTIFSFTDSTDMPNIVRKIQNFISPEILESKDLQETAPIEKIAEPLTGDDGNASPPSVLVEDRSIELNKVVSASAWFNATDKDNDDVVFWLISDEGPWGDSGHFVGDGWDLLWGSAYKDVTLFGGSKLPGAFDKIEDGEFLANRKILVGAKDIAKLKFEAASTAQNDRIVVQAYDGLFWSPEVVFQVQSVELGGEDAPEPEPMPTAPGVEAGSVRLSVAGPTVDKIGYSVEAELIDGNVTFPLIPPTATATGTLVETQITILGDIVDFDFSATDGGQFTTVSGGFNGYVIQDVGDSLSPIVGVEIVEGTTSLGLVADDIGFTEDRITVNVEDLVYDPSSTAQILIEFGREGDDDTEEVIAPIEDDKEEQLSYQLADTVWNVTGADEAGNAWGGSTLVFTEQEDTADGADLKGYFQWSGSDGQYGKEIFEGDIDGAGMIELIGVGLEEPHSGIATYVYEAALAGGGTAITAGSWGGGGGIPGTWEATLVEGATPPVTDPEPVATPEPTPMPGPTPTPPPVVIEDEGDDEFDLGDLPPPPPPPVTPPSPPSFDPPAPAPSPGPTPTSPPVVIEDEGDDEFDLGDLPPPPPPPDVPPPPPPSFEPPEPAPEPMEEVDEFEDESEVAMDPVEETEEFEPEPEEITGPVEDEDFDEEPEPEPEPEDETEEFEVAADPVEEADEPEPEPEEELAEPLSMFVELTRSAEPAPEPSCAPDDDACAMAAADAVDWGEAPVFDALVA